MIKKTAFALLLVLLLFSCKKDKLVGEYEILEGSWSLGYIVERSYNQFSGTTFDTLFPASINNTYRLEFLSKGILKQYTDGELVEKYRIVFDFFGPANAPEYDFLAHIRLNNSPDESMVMQVSQNEMATSRGHISEDYVSYTNGNNEISYEFIYFKD